MATELVIEKGVPVPTPRNRTILVSWADMEVGDSVHFPAAEYRREQLYQASCQYGRRNGKKFSVRKTDTGWRVWRVE